MKDIKLILASTSPRRRHILEKMGLDFEIIPSDYEEVLENNIFSYEKIENLAYNKAKSVAISKDFSQCSIILSADTVVVLDNTILGKPQDKQDAVCMLTNLSGKKHSVVTSICAISSNNKKILSTTSYVEFEELSEEKIINYVETFNPLDKAGSYGIQELPKGFVKSVEGSFENIIGLCPKAVEELLKEFGYQG